MPARKLAIGLAHVFHWTNADGLLAANPLLAVDWPAGAVSYPLTLSRQVDSVTAISADRRTLTATWGGSGSPTTAISGDQPAAVVLQSIGLVGASLRVVRIVSDDGITGTLELAEPVPHPVALGVNPANLHWLQRIALIPSVDLPATPTRNIRWTVDYEARDAFNVEPLQCLRDRDVLHVVAMAFATGLTDAQLLEVVPDLKARPSGQGSWRAQREAALDELIGMVRKRIAPRVEDVLPGRAFANAHAYLTAARILDGRLSAGPDLSAQATYLRGLAVDMVEQQLALIDWQDVNINGEVDSGETDAGARSSAALSSIASTYTMQSAIDYIDDGAPFPVQRVRVTDER